METSLFIKRQSVKENETYRKVKLSDHKGFNSIWHRVSEHRVSEYDIAYRHSWHRSLQMFLLRAVIYAVRKHKPSFAITLA